MLAHRLEHVRLSRNVVNCSPIAIHELTIDLRGDMQDRRTGRQRFDLRTGRIARGGAGAGDDDAERTRHARIGIRHIHRAGFAARWNEANPALPPDRIQYRHVVDRDDAEDRRHAHIGERARDSVADRLGHRGGLDGLRSAAGHDFQVHRVILRSNVT